MADYNDGKWPPSREVGVSLDSTFQNGKRKLPSADTVQHPQLLYSGPIIYVFDANKAETTASALLCLMIESLPSDLQHAIHQHVQAAGSWLERCGREGAGVAGVFKWSSDAALSPVPMTPSPACVLGFDLEWRISFITGQAPPSVALVQLCYESPQGPRCYLFQISECGLCPSLVVLLACPFVLKVGVNSSGDANKMRYDHEVQMEGVLDLSPYAKERLPHPPSRWSLDGLVSAVFKRSISKSESVRRSNWEKVPLSQEQLSYASTDAFVGLKLYLALSTMKPLQVVQKRQDLVPLSSGSLPAGTTTPCSFESWPSSQLTPAKMEVYQFFHDCHMSIEAIATQRGIRETTVSGYLADAIIQGFAYEFHRFNIHDEALFHIMMAVSRAYAEKQESAFDMSQSATPTRPDAVYETLGITSTFPPLSAIKLHLSDEITYSQLRLALAHLHRLRVKDQIFKVGTDDVKKGTDVSVPALPLPVSVDSPEPTTQPRASAIKVPLLPPSSSASPPLDLTVDDADFDDHLLEDDLSIEAEIRAEETWRAPTGPSPASSPALTRTKSSYTHGKPSKTAQGFV